jgi:hypothetical protein
MGERTYRVAPHPLHKDCYVVWCNETMGPGAPVAFPLITVHNVAMGPAPGPLAEKLARMMDAPGFWEQVIAPFVPAQVKHMVNRFLGWRLPANFRPDNGITFTPTQHQQGEYAQGHWPVGTNLLSAQQAEEMVEYMIEGMPGA